MLDLSTLHSTLSQILHIPDIHTAILLSATGDLISYASDPIRPKDQIRTVVGLAGEVWAETKQKGVGMVDSDEMGRIIVLPVDDDREEGEELPEDYQPLMLLALNGTDRVGWEELKADGKTLASHLAKPFSKFREHLAVAKPPLPTPPNTSSASASSVTRPA